MKWLLRLLVGLGLAASAASAPAELSPVSFVLGKQEFKPGDAIVIDQVLATSPQFEIGTKVVVRGHYVLASAAKAQLGLRVTQRAPARASSVAPSQSASIQNQSGSFELSCDITHAGDPHVSFYPASGGASFGGVYFSAAPQPSDAEEVIFPGGQSVPAELIRSTESFLRPLGTHPLLGRDFIKDDFENDSTPVAIVSHALWSAAGSPSEIIGAKIKAADQEFVVLAVAPKSPAPLEGRKVWLVNARQSVASASSP